MPADRTEVTEVVTGLATFGAPDLATALADPPAAFGGVGEARWDRLRALARDGRYRAEFAAAWGNGSCFLAARDGLRGAEPIPADLRIDHVYLVSCKYNSRIQLNASPWSIFDPGVAAGGDWYGEVAPEPLAALYDTVCFETGLAPALPARPSALAPPQRRQLAAALGRGPWTSAAAGEAYAALSAAVAEASALRWRAALRASERRREATLWRFLRGAAASYFVLGSDGDRMVRLRVGSPWDWRQSFRLRRFEVEVVPSRQPVVGWAATVDGRSAAPPEAKVYLDTPHHEVPGYWPLT